MLLSHPYLAPGGSPAWCATRVRRVVIDFVLADEKRLVDSPYYLTSSHKQM